MVCDVALAMKVWLGWGTPSRMGVTRYPVIGEPWSLSGASHETVADPLPGPATGDRGADGAPMATGLLAADSAPVPLTFIAATRKVRVSPSARPATVCDVAFEVKVCAGRATSPA